MKKFTDEFKKKAIKLKERGIHPNKIFEDAGFNISSKQKDYTSKTISKWKQTLPKSKEQDWRKKLEYLEAQVAYLKAENDFLKQLPEKK